MNYLLIDNLNNLMLDRLYNRVQGDCIVEIVSSYLKSFGNKVDIMNMLKIEFTKQDILSHDCIIIKINEDNVNYALKMYFDHIFLEKKICFISINEDIKDYIPLELLKMYYNFDERKDLFINIFEFSRVLNLDISNEAIKVKLDSINTFDLDQKRMALMVGVGCSRQCNFCSISNTPVQYFSLDSIIKNIRNNVENGVKSFHINNHSFCSNLNYVREFCNLLMKECGHLNFKWSCFIMPEAIISDIEIIGILKKSKLDRIEIGVENINQIIQNDFNINVLETDVFRIIEECQNVEISSIVINYINGAPLETTETLKNSKDFLEKIVLKTFGFVDINLFFFYPDLNTKFRNFESIDNIHFEPKKCIGRKYDTAQNTFFLSANEIYNWQIDLVKNLFIMRKDLFNKLTAKQRLNNMFLSEYGIVTQAWQYYLFSTISTFAEFNKSFERYFFINEILENAHYFTAQLYKTPVVSDIDNKYYVYVDPVVAGKDDKAIDISEFNLYHLLIAKTTIADIISINTKDCKNSQNIKNEIVDKFEALENAHLITYEKILS